MMRESGFIMGNAGGVPYVTEITDFEFAVELPRPPDFRTIDGWGLKPEEQYFRRPELPEYWTDRYIKRMAETAYAFNDGKKVVPDYEWWRTNPEDRMVEYAEREWDRRKNGYWFMNNGAAFYITGQHYYHLTYWTMEDGQRPEFRSREWKWFHAWKVIEDDPVCLGSIYPKMRREGATERCLSVLQETGTAYANIHNGIQSKTDGSARAAFKRLVKSHRRMPLFYSVIQDGTSDPDKELKFFKPARRLTHKTGTLFEGEDVEALESLIDYKSTKSTSYDGEKMFRYLHDEAGKIEVQGVKFDETWRIIKECLLVGNRVVGKAMIPSTVAELDRRGGKHFEKIFFLSDPKNRNKNGMTASGLYRMFLPAYDGLEGFIDRYGMSVIDEPTQEQADYLCARYPENRHLYDAGVGARQFLLNKRSFLLEQSDSDGLAMEIRQYPLRWEECFRADGRECHFDSLLLDKRIEELKVLGPKMQPWVSGYLEWKDGKRFGTVRFVPAPWGTMSAKFKIAGWIPKEDREVNHMGVESRAAVEFAPGFRPNDVARGPGGRTFGPKHHNLFAIGMDPVDHYMRNMVVKADDSEEFGNSGIRSNAAMYVFRKYDHLVDGGKPVEEWLTHNFFIEYVGRTKNPQDMWEDSLMLCWWLSAKIMIESQKFGVLNWFIQAGCEAFLDTKPRGVTKDGTLRVTQDKGIAGSTQLHEAIMEEISIFVGEHGMRVPFKRLLQDWREFTIENVEDYDPTIASGLALVTARRRTNRAVASGNDGMPRGVQLAKTYRR